MGDKLDSIEQLKQTEELLKQEKKREQAEEAKEAKAEAKTGEKTETRPEASIGSKADAKLEAKETKQKDEKKAEEKKKKLVLERVYAIPLMKAYEKSRSHRGRIAMSLLRRFLARHVKASSPASIYVDQKVNSAVLARGSRSPPKKLRVLVQKDEEGKVVATLAA